LPAKHDYELTIDLNSLNHLGIGLYSNIPAVVSEVVANSWDADASRVDIAIDRAAGVIRIKDDGWGMTQEEINEKYLKVGYNKRGKEPAVTPKRRHVMGRKGIGKLALFSIAETIEVQSSKRNPSTGTVQKRGCVLRARDIKAAIKAGRSTYHPKALRPAMVTVAKGTLIVLRGLYKSIDTTERFLRRRLARRFSVIGSEYGFSVSVNGKPISVEDRDYFPKIEYVWTIGKGSEKYADYCENARRKNHISGTVNRAKGYEVTGWVGTFDEQKSIEAGNNSVVILAWGKLIHEDILKDIKEGGIFTKYLIGEIRADFLDFDAQSDIATTDRQSLKETDPRFIALRTFVQGEVLRVIQNNWRNWRNEEAEKKALENPKIKAWFEQLTPDNKKYARILFGKIESFPIEDPEYKRDLYRHGILAFESLALRENLDALNELDGTESFGKLTAIFTSMDELEAMHYWQITKTRVEVLKTFERILPSARERVLQEHIFNHLWLMDPSWERASTDERIEQAVVSEWKKLDAKLSTAEKRGRIDIRYRTAVGKHIIIELKRYARKVTATELVDQIRKYKGALEKCLRKVYPDRPIEIEVICILGDRPEPRDDDSGNRKMLEAVKARYITYDQLIQQTRDSYRDYLAKEKEISRIQELIESL